MISSNTAAFWSGDATALPYLGGRDCYSSEYTKLQPSHPTAASFSPLNDSCCRFVLLAFVDVGPLSRSLILVLLAIGCVHPNPGPRQQPPPPPPCIVSWNFNGLGNSATEINDYLSRKNVLVACIQETKLSQGSRLPSFPALRPSDLTELVVVGVSSLSSITPSPSLKSSRQSTTAPPRSSSSK